PRVTGVHRAAEDFEQFRADHVEALEFSRNEGCVMPAISLFDGGGTYSIGASTGVLSRRVPFVPLFRGLRRRSDFCNLLTAESALASAPTHGAQARGLVAFPPSS